MSVVQVEDLRKRFGHVAVLDGLSLTIDEGSVYALVGPNGAGKTTTLRVLMNITEPTSGRAAVLGTDSRRLGVRQFEQIGYVSENQAMPDWMTVAYYMDYLRPFYSAWDRGLETTLLRQFDLPPDRKLKHLSRGMRMKAALASSLAYRPKLLVLDEPFSGLDPLVRDEVVEGLVACADETTILISSHDLAEIESFSTHIGYLDHGHLQFSQPIDVLSARFREVEVTVQGFEGLPINLPPSWLRLERASNVIRFIESRFDDARIDADVRRAFGETAQVAVAPMSLRAIFVALARASRKAA